MKKIVFKSLLAILVYLGIYFTANLEPVKETFDDVAYDKMTIDGVNLIDEYVTPVLGANTVPKLNLFLVDERYLDENNLSEYGYFFPRKEMAAIVDGINRIATGAKEPIKALFIDYNFEYTEKPYGHQLSQGDETFLRSLLAFDKRTAILIPRVGEFSFIESYLKKHGIEAQNIIFVSPNFFKSDDLLARRMQPYVEAGEKLYPHVALVLYMLHMRKCGFQELSSMKKIDDETAELCGMTIDAFDVTHDRVATKLFHEYDENLYNAGYTFWDGTAKIQKIKSVANIMEESVLPKVLSGSIVFLGSSFDTSGDHIEIPFSIAFDPVTVPGILLHLSAINTLVFQDGFLERFNPLLGSLIVFTVFFIFAYGEARFKEKSKVIEFLVSVFMMTVVFYSISFIIYIYDKTWFSWLSPLVTYQVLDLLDKFFMYKSKVSNVAQKIKGKK